MRPCRLAAAACRSCSASAASAPASPTQENDVLKQIQAFFSTTGLPASSYPDSDPPTIETAIFVKSHLKKRLFSLPRGPSTSSTRQES